MNTLARWFSQLRLGLAPVLGTAVCTESPGQRYSSGPFDYTFLGEVW